MKPILFCGPCVIESASLLETVAEYITTHSVFQHFDVYFKASFDKANRTSLQSFRGPGIDVGMEMLQHIKESYNLKIITDIHEPSQAEKIAEVADIIQIPAFLCRQTDLLLAAGQTGKTVNIKKGQFLAGDDMFHAVEKVRKAGASAVFTTERGTFFGYHDLVVDFRNIPLMKAFSDAVIMDCTHSVQVPASKDSIISGGHPEYIASMSMAARAFGADGYYFEVHPNPSQALSDAGSMLRLDLFNNILSNLIEK